MNGSFPGREELGGWDSRPGFMKGWIAEGNKGQFRGRQGLWLGVCGIERRAARNSL